MHCCSFAHLTSPCGNEILESEPLKSVEIKSFSPLHDGGILFCNFLFTFLSFKLSGLFSNASHYRITSLELQAFTDGQLLFFVL